LSADKTISLRVIEPFRVADHVLLLVDHPQNLPKAESMENAVIAFTANAVHRNRLGGQQPS